MDAELVKNGDGIAVHFRLIDDKARDLRVAAKPEVVHNRPLERLIEFLMHHGDAVCQRLLAAGKIHFASFQINVAAVLVVNAEQALHQRRFSRAVFTHQGVNGTGLNFQTDFVQRPDARKGLRNIRHPEQYGLFHLISS